MDKDIERLRADIASLRYRLKEANSQLENRIKACRHDWDETKYDPIIEKGYHMEAVKAGSDSMPAYDVPDRETKRWSRTCKTCGHVEYTEKERIAKMEADFDAR